MAYWAQALFWLSAVGAIISVTGIYLLFVSLRHTRTAIADTREIGEAQVRAYLSVSADDGEFPIIGYKTLRPSAETKIRNYGASPAINCKTAAALMCRQIGFPSQNRDAFRVC